MSATSSPRSVSPELIAAWCGMLLGAEADAAPLTLEQYLAGIPRLASLADVASGTPVLVRGDVDAKPGAKMGDGDVRLRSMVETLHFGRQRGWKQIVFGHIGRKPEGSLGAVAERLGAILNCDVPLVADWFDEATMTIPDGISARIAQLAPGAIVVLENTRKYEIERVLWKAKPADIERLSGPLARFAQQCAAKLARVYVNEALSAGSLDASTTIVPAAMDRVALGAYVGQEFDGPMRRCLAAQLVVFSGLKTDKLDDLEAMIRRGTVRWVFTAGSLAMALKKASAMLAGEPFALGVAEDLAHADKPYYIEPARIEQARQMLVDGRRKGIEFVLPVDFVLQDGRTSTVIGPSDQQFDVGPTTSRHFAAAIDRFLAVTGARPELPESERPVAFHNGVFGWFEDPRFEEGTRRFMGELKRMRDAGALVYIGGGEGGAALEKYGQPDWVTHCFTAGGTVLNALGAAPVPYLQALHRAARRE